jgi:hypothetical protein
VRIGGAALTPKPAADADATTVERLAALMRPLPPRADGYLAIVARRAYESSMLYGALRRKLRVSDTSPRLLS